MFNLLADFDHYLRGGGLEFVFSQQSWQINTKI